MDSWRKAYGALKDSTTVAKVNSEYKDLDVAIVKATNHVVCPPKERHVRKILAATSIIRPRADVAYCIYALSRRLKKTRNWTVALKVLIVIHRTLREGDPTFREELLNYSIRGHVLQIANFKDDSSPLAWDCSAWVRTYALFLEERLECFRVLKYDVETENLYKSVPGTTKEQSRKRNLGSEELLEQLPALQKLLFRLVGCQPEGAAFHNYLVQYALTLVLKESFKIYCAINDGIINLVDMFFEMSRHDALKALNIYKRAGQQAEWLSNFYEFCKGLDMARSFLFPKLKQPPPSFLATMEEYIREAPRVGSISCNKMEYQENNLLTYPQEPTPPPEPETVNIETPSMEEEPSLPSPKNEIPDEPVPSDSETVDLLGLNELNPLAIQLEQSNAQSLAIVPSGIDSERTSQNALSEIASSSSGWELALVATPSSNTTHLTGSKLAGGFDKLLLDSLYEDAETKRTLNPGNGVGIGVNSFNTLDPFAISNRIAPPTNVQMAILAQQQQYIQQQQYMMNMMAYPYPPYHYHPQPQMGGSTNPFGDPFAVGYTQNTTQQGYNGLL